MVQKITRIKGRFWYWEQKNTTQEKDEDQDGTKKRSRRYHKKGRTWEL